MRKRTGSFLAVLGWAEAASVMIFVLALPLPFLTGSMLVYSIANQILVAVVAAFSVYLMLRMNLLSFATPAFMAIGGYAVAITAGRGMTNVILLTGISILVPAIVALPLGALVLRLRGTYFVLVTFVLTEILQLLLFVTPGLTGGSNGIAGIPAVTLFNITFADNQAVWLLATVFALLAVLATVVVTYYFRPHFAAIEENEILAQSLGLPVWRYKVIGFVVAAGLAGLAGFSLVIMLLTAHPSSFSAMSSVNYIAYTFVGGEGSILGPILGSALLVWAFNLFGGQGQYSQGFYGLLIIAVVMVARGGLVGAFESAFRRWGSVWLPPPPGRSKEREGGQQ
jgi:branched-chain amino acid transport system permease protein